MGGGDLGTMSSRYVFASLGLFPQAPGRGELLLSSPAFPYARVTPQDRPPITITAPAAGPEAVYVHGVRLNGADHGHSWLPESFLAEGGHLSFTLSKSPNTTWATAPEELPVDR